MSLRFFGNIYIDFEEFSDFAVAVEHLFGSTFAVCGVSSILDLNVELVLAEELAVNPVLQGAHSHDSYGLLVE